MLMIFTGDMDMVIDTVMLAKDDDRDRFRDLIVKAIQSKEISPTFHHDCCLNDDDDAPAPKKNKMTSSSSNKNKSSTSSASSAAEALKKEAKAKKRKEEAAKEAIEAEEMLKEIQLKAKQRGQPTGDGGLADMILARNNERKGNFDSWAEGLEARYKEMERKKKEKKNAKKSKN
jgi:hypothetical protein